MDVGNESDKTLKLEAAIYNSDRLHQDAAITALSQEIESINKNGSSIASPVVDRLNQRGFWDPSSDFGYVHIHDGKMEIDWHYLNQVKELHKEADEVGDSWTIGEDENQVLRASAKGRPDAVAQLTRDLNKVNEQDKDYVNGVHYRLNSQTFLRNSPDQINIVGLTDGKLNIDSRKLQLGFASPHVLEDAQILANFAKEHDLEWHTMDKQQDLGPVLHRVDLINQQGEEHTNAVLREIGREDPNILPDFVIVGGKLKAISNPWDDLIARTFWYTESPPHW
jgi:hypothetical protein